MKVFQPDEITITLTRNEVVALYYALDPSEVWVWRSNLEPHGISPESAHEVAIEFEKKLRGIVDGQN